MRDMNRFDRAHGPALARIWFLGDVHGQFKFLVRALQAAPVPPRWLVFLGDIDIDHKPFREILAPLHQAYPGIQVAFIHGNHDADTDVHWAMLHDCGLAVPLHARVRNLDGVRVAGLGGVFQGRVWRPPGGRVLSSKDRAKGTNSTSASQWRGAQRPRPKLNGAIYPDEFDALGAQNADILVTHEAPSCHPHGFAALDDLARSLGVVRSFHGHHHDDRSEAYARVRPSLGFDARGVSYCAIKDGLGRVIHPGEEGW